jgi:hypothetical protein
VNTRRRICRRRGITSEPQRRKLTRELYLSLDMMAVAFGLATAIQNSDRNVDFSNKTW